jgi:hypothetical protein
MRCAKPGAVPNERGIALAVAVFALIVIGGLVAGSFLPGVLEQQSGRNTVYIAQASEAAETELRVVGSLVPAGILAGLPVGGASFGVDSISIAPGTTVVRQISRITGTLYLIRSRGTRRDADGRPLATRTVGLLTRLAIDSVSRLDSLVPLGQRAWVQLY